MTCAGGRLPEARVLESCPVKKIALVAACASVALTVAAAPSAHAALTLTQAGIDDGFVLSTFVSGYSFNTYGPIGQGIDSAGHVITGSAGDMKVYVFKDVDNQHLSDALSATTYAAQTGNPNMAMTTLNGHVYGAQLQGGAADYREFFDDGTSTPLPGAVNAPGGLSNDLGMWGDPSSGLLYVASNSGIAKVNPLTGAFTLIDPGVFPDGITVSPDGKTLYAEVAGGISSFNAATGAFLQSYNVGHSPDGTGVIVGGLFDGQVIVNNNDGTVGLLNPTNSDYALIASGGTRGDFVSPDRSNGTLFMSALDAVYRLSCGPNCSIGSQTPGVPEPSTWALMIAGFGAVGAAMRRKIRQGALSA
jgi:hypothetical protein